jgi:hypothetical protein
VTELRTKSWHRSICGCSQSVNIMHNPQGGANTNHKQLTSAYASTEVSALPACICTWIRFSWGSHNSTFGRPQESLKGCEEMTEIKFWGCTYRGTAEGDHGVFTRSDGTFYAGKIAGGSACVGVLTLTNGNTIFAECDADGKFHGRRLDCYADGETRYRLYEHGSVQDLAVLYADGTCEYNGEACRADYAPFVALQAKVVPIKARPRTSDPTSRLYAPILSPAIVRQSVPSAIVLALAGAGDDPRRHGAHLPPSPSASAISLHGPCGTATAKQMHRASNLDDAPAEGCTARAPRPHA